MCVIRIGGEESEFLSITVLGRSHPECNDFWDGNWLRARVEIAVGGFRALVICDLRSEELRQFHCDLARLQETTRGVAEFFTMERWLFLRVVGDGRGHVLFQCKVNDNAGIGNTLSCELNVDQTFVRLFLGQLAIALQVYPVVGEEEEIRKSLA
jgi:hypothetical protein